LLGSLWHGAATGHPEIDPEYSGQKRFAKLEVYARDRPHRHELKSRTPVRTAVPILTAFIYLPARLIS